MKFTKHNWFTYGAGFLSFLLVILVERMEVMKSVNESILGPILLGCMVFAVCTIFVFIEGEQ